MCVCCSFDLIYDAVGDEEIASNAATLLRPFSGAIYVSIVIPLLRNVDVNGVTFGLTKSACQLSASVAKVSLSVLYCIFTVRLISGLKVRKKKCHL